MKIILKNSLFYSIFYGILLYIVKMILNKHNIDFLNWFYYLSYGLMIILFILGIFQIILKINNKIIRKISSIIYLILVIIIAYIIVYFYRIFYTPQYIVTKDNKKMVAEVIMFHHTNIYYYNYKNSFMKSYKPIENEYYSNGAHNPFETEYEYMELIEKD